MPEYKCIYRENFLEDVNGIAIITVGSDARRENAGKTSPLEVALVAGSSDLLETIETTRGRLKQIPDIFPIIEVKYLDLDFYKYQNGIPQEDGRYKNDNYPSRVIDAEFISGDYTIFRLMKSKFDTFLRERGRDARPLIRKERYRVKYFKTKLDEALEDRDYFAFDYRDTAIPEYREDISIRIKMTTLRLMQAYVTTSLMQLIREGVVDTLEIPHQTDKRFAYLLAKGKISSMKESEELRDLYKYFLKKYIQGKRSRFFDPGREPDFRKNLKRLQLLFG